MTKECQESANESTPMMEEEGVRDIDYNGNL
jgi:hypothetical protein